MRSMDEELREDEKEKQEKDPSPTEDSNEKHDPFPQNFDETKDVVKNLSENLKTLQETRNQIQVTHEQSYLNDIQDQEPNQQQDTLQEKQAQIQNLEREIQDKIRIIESNKEQVEHVHQLQKDLTNLKLENSTLTDQLQTQIAEYTMLKDEGIILDRKIEALETNMDKQASVIGEYKENLQKIQSLEGENLHLAGDLELLLEDKNALQVKINDLTQEFDEIQLNCAQHEEIGRIHVMDIEKLHSELVLKENRILELSQDLESKNQEIGSLQQNLSKTGENFQVSGGDLASQLMEKDVLIDDLKQEIRSYEDKHITMVDRAEYERIQAELSGINRQLETSKEKLDAKEQEITLLTDKFQEEQSLATVKSREIHSLNSEIRALGETLQDKEEALQDYERQEEEFHEALMEKLKIMAEKEDQSDQIKILIEQKEVLFHRIEDLNQTDRGHQAIIARLEKQTNTLEKSVKESEKLTGAQMKDNIELEFLRKQCDTLNKDLHQQISIASEARGKFEILSDQLESLKRQFKNVEDLLDKRSQEITLLRRHSQEEITSGKEKITQLEKQIFKFETNIRELSQSLQKAKVGTEFQAQIRTLKLDLKEQETIAETLADDVSKSNIEAMVYRRENAQFKEEIVQLKRRVKLLRRDLMQH